MFRYKWFYKLKKSLRERGIMKNMNALMVIGKQTIVMLLFPTQS